MRQLVKRVMEKLRHLVNPKTEYSRCISYSQAGEDAVLYFLMEDKKMGNFSYLDIGANMPDYGNNTYLFYTRGNRGVCVEADKTLLPRLKALRPEDTILHAGVAVGEEKQALFYVFNNRALNTFDKAEAEKRASYGQFKIEEVLPVRLVNINELISSHYKTYPDLLSLDIEGLDLAVLKSLDLHRFPVPVICVETCTYSENHIRLKNHDIAEYLGSRNYELYADTYINSIFVNKHWFYQTG
jgi:FkbM family methyltransferase